VLQRVDFSYDAFGDRITKTVDPDGGGPQAPTTTRFSYDGSDVWADLNTSNQLQTRRVYGDGVDQPLARLTSAGAASWYLPDRLGSVRDVTDASGAVTDHINYDAFGNIVTETNPTGGDRYKYTAREYDPETNQQYNRGRYYDPPTGRWTGEDPIRLGAGDPNLYRYVRNSPTRHTDPSGLDPGSPPPLGPPDLQGMTPAGDALSRLTREAAKAELERQAREAEAQRDMENALKNMQLPLGLKPEDYPAFGKGVAKGFYGGAEDLVGGICDLARLSAKYNIFSAMYRGLKEGEWFRDERDALRPVARIARSLLDMGRRLHGYEGLIADALARGDMDQLAAIDPQLAAALEVSKDLLDKWLRDVNNMRPEDKGRVVGRILFEVALALATWGAVEAVQAGKLADLANLATKLKSLPGFKSPRVLKAVDRLIEVLEKGPPKNPCFPAETAVATVDGLKPIQAVRQDDRVWAYDLAARQWRLCPVVATYEHDYEGDLVALTVAGEVIEATANHPFWVVEGDSLDRRERPAHVPAAPSKSPVPGRWVDAGALRVGDVLLLQPDRRAPVERLAVRHACLNVYNLQVEGPHTYAVGAGRILVHNKMLNRRPRRGNVNLPGGEPCAGGNPNAARPVIQNRLPARVTRALPEGDVRTPAERKQARNFYKRNIDQARKWWEERSGQQWPVDPETGKPQWAEHPRPIKDGGDPLLIRPGDGADPNAPHLIPGPDGLTDQQRWGAMGGRPKKPR
jgi:RHS repeat-associated protein